LRNVSGKHKCALQIDRDMNFKFIFLLFLGMFISKSIFSQWVQTNGPQGLINIFAIEQRSGETIALTKSGLFYNESIEGIWNYKTSIDFNTFSKKGDSLFFGGYYSGIKLLDLSKPNNLPVNSGLEGATVLAINHSDNCLYAGIQYGGFCKSLGFSNTWIYNINDGLPADTMYIPERQGGGVRYTYDVFSIEIKNNEIYCGTKNGVYKTDVNNVSWTSASNGLPQKKVNLIKCVDDTLFAFLNNKLFIDSSSDHWIEFFSSTSKITSINKFNGVFYTTTLGSGIYSSSDNGKNWNSLNYGLTDLNINDLNYIDSVLVCGTSTDGFYFYKDQKWNKNNDGVVCSTIHLLTSNKNLLIAADNNKVYTSSDHNNWNDISSNISFQGIARIECTEANVFVSCTQNSKPKIKYYSTEKKTWFDLENPNLNLSLGEFYPIVIENSRLYIWADKILSTNDLGLTWDVVSFPDNWNQYKFFNTVELITPSGSNYEFTKDNWKLSNSGLPFNAEIFGFAKTTDALYVYVYAKGIFVSLDNGNSWSLANNGLNPDQGFTSYAFKDKNLFITTQSGVFYTDNYGQDWHSLNEGLINKNANGIAILNDTLYVGIYGNGVWKCDINNIPLYTNEFFRDNGGLKIYPNPAKTNIEIQTDGVESGDLKIFDILGNQIFYRKIITNEPIDISEIKDGLYLLNFTTKNKSYSNKLIINR
jgi:hypothetical protein